MTLPATGITGITGITGTTGIVLCGGRSRRMGRPKALLPWRGRTLVEHVVATLAGVVDEVVVVGSESLTPSLPALDARVVVDREPDLGPLAGIREGLAAGVGDLAFVTSTDAPFLSPAFVQAMLAHGEAVAVEVDGYVQTLGAVYPRRALSIAEDLLAAGRRRPLDLLEALDFRCLTADAVPDVRSVQGVNTPDAYLDAVRACEPDARVRVELHGAARRAAGADTVEWPVATLGEVLAGACPGLRWIDAGLVAASFRVSLGDGGPTRDGGIPVGPGERVVVTDAP